MIRTIISLEEGDKRWLDAEAAREGVPMTEVIRRAVRRMRQELERAGELDALLAATRGIGSGEDGLEVQRRLRDEWEQHPA
ncbi:MAG: ribbon-helix-helix protein, CopG family [Thermoanaerobaculaceae bacterium]